MKKFKMPITEMMEIKNGVGLMVENDKLPIVHIMSLSEVKQEISPYLKLYTDAVSVLEKRLADKVLDPEGNEVDAIPANKTVEYLREKLELGKKEYEVKMPTFSIADLGHDPKKPTINKYSIPVGAIVGLGRLVERK